MCGRAQLVEQIQVVVRRMGNGVDRLISAVAMVGTTQIPVTAMALDVDDARVRDMLYIGATREGFDIPVDAVLEGGVWEVGDETHIRAWRA